MKWTIRKKLGLGFVSIVLLIFISMGVTIVLGLRMTTASDHLIKEQFPSMKAFNEYKMHIQDRSAYYERYILTEDKGWLKYIEDTQKKYDKALHDFLTHPLSKEESRLINQFQSLSENYYKELDEIVTFVKSHPGERQEAYKLLIGALRYRKEIGPIFQELIKKKQLITNTTAANLQKNLNSSRIISLISGILAIIIGTILSIFLGRNISRPIVSLTKVADAISLGDFSKSINIQTNDEIGDLAKALERMSKSLQKAMKRFRKVNT